MFNNSDKLDCSPQPGKSLKNTMLQSNTNKEKDVFDDHLLRLVLERPPLFNYCLPSEERSVSICNYYWQEIADELTSIYGPFELEYIKSKYKYHRNKFTRYRCAVSQMKNGSSPLGPVKIIVPKHMKILSRLDTLIRDYKKKSVNFPNTKPYYAPTSVCRTCLTEKIEMESIFSMQRVNNALVQISTMISLCTGLEFSEYDNFSNAICDVCINAVSLAYEFRSKCWVAHSVLLQKQKPQQMVEPNPPSSVETLNIIEFVYESETEIIDEPKLCQPTPMPVKRRKVDRFINVSELNDKLKEYVEITLDETVYRGKRYKCRHCEQKYLAAHLMIDHLENIHKFSIKRDTWLKCEECSRKFPNQYRLAIHARQHKDLKVICQQCGVSVPKGRFAEHFRRHTGEKPFKCDLCDFRAAQISSLSKHKLTHTGERPALCHICGRAYRTASRRAKHMRSHSDERPFKCIICKKSFKQNELLKGHMQTHDPSKQYECEICSRKFSQKGTHRVHMMQHTGRRPHTCSECGKGFIQRHCWRTHMKNHHKITVQ